MYITPSQTNLLSEWKLDGNSTDTLAAHNGTDTNITYVGGKIGQCASFAGNGKIATANNIGITGTGNCTFLAWVKTTGNTFVPFGFGVYSAAAWRGLRIQANGCLQLDIYNSNLADTAVVVNDGKWHLVGFGNNGTTAYLYVDGRNIKNGVLAAMNTGAGVVLFGQTPNPDGYYTGQIEQATIWSRLLSDAEIASYYALSAADGGGILTNLAGNFKNN